MQEHTGSDYLAAFKGSFTSALRWHHLDDLWERLRARPEGWFVYAVGHELPKEPLSDTAFIEFLSEIDALLRAEHDEDYCGIVYADDLKNPAFVKIYDPNNLGVSCGFSDNPPLPGWILSRIPPVELESRQTVANNRKRWWQWLFDRDDS